MDDLISGGFSNEPKRASSRDSVRVVSWNIERGLQFSAIANFLQDAEADLILLQEVDLNARRTQHRDVAFELARSLNLNYVFGKEFREPGTGSEVSPAHPGLATLSRGPLENGRIIRFQQRSNFLESALVCTPERTVPTTARREDRSGDGSADPWPKTGDLQPALRTQRERESPTSTIAAGLGGRKTTR